MQKESFLWRYISSVVKKGVLIGACLFVFACGWTARMWPERNAGETQDISQKSDVSLGKHVAPMDADVGAYLAGVLSRENQDMSRAADYYAQALKKDPDNKSLQSDVYLIAGLAGKTDTFVKTASIVAAHQNPLFADIVMAADSVKKQEYAAALKITEGQPRQEMNALLFPILRAWSYAGLGENKKALSALTPLKGNKDIEPVYWYHQALLLDYFGQKDEAGKAYQELSKREIPSITSLLAIRSFYIKNGNWTPENPLFNKYYQTVQKTPALAEILVGQADEFSLNTPTKGVAEAFYMVSVISGTQAKAPETGLLFNSLALYLNPDSTLYKIWGAEQFEGVQYYAEANRLYESIQKPSDTILFKKSLNMMLLDQNMAAEKVLLDIVTRQPNDPLLLTMMGDLYRNTNRLGMAITYYTRAISALEKIDDKALLSKTHLSRASVYEAQGNKAKVETDLKKALDLSPNNASVLNYLGYSWLEENKNIPQAMAYVQAAEKLAPEDAHIWDSLAWGYYRKGEYEKALGYAEKAADKIPYSAIVQAHLGDIYGAMGRSREAGYQYKKALELKEDLTPALKAELQKKVK